MKETVWDLSFFTGGLPKNVNAEGVTEDERWMAARTALTAGMAARFAIGMELLDVLLDIRDELVMARNYLTNASTERKAMANAISDRRRDGSNVRVTRRRLKVNVSLRRTNGWLLLLRRWSGAVGDAHSMTFVVAVRQPITATVPCSYCWPHSAVESFKYKGSTGDKQLSYDITSTAANKLECHKKATGHSKARIVQTLILTYKPLPFASLSVEWWKCRGAAS